MSDQSILGRPTVAPTGVNEFYGYVGVSGGLEYPRKAAMPVPGTVSANAPVVADASKDVAGLRNVAVTGSMLSSSASAGIGYATGAGAAVTQATDRTTAVTCTGMSGQITTNNASLAAEAAAEFTVTNTSVAIGDVVVPCIQSGTNGGNTAVIVSTVAAGSFKLKVCNNNAAAGTAETGAIIINFAIIKAVAA